MNEDNPFSMADVYTMLAVNILIHSLIFWYMDGLLPGDFGMPKPVYFPFTVAALFTFSTQPDKSSSHMSVITIITIIIIIMIMITTTIFIVLSS